MKNLVLSYSCLRAKKSSYTPPSHPKHRGRPNFISSYIIGRYRQYRMFPCAQGTYHSTKFVIFQQNLKFFDKFPTFCQDSTSLNNIEQNLTNLTKFEKILSFGQNLTNSKCFLSIVKFIVILSYIENGGNQPISCLFFFLLG